MEGNAVKVCEIFETNKTKRRDVPENVTQRSTEVMDLVHKDVLGPIAEHSVDGHNYAIRFASSFRRVRRV